MCATKQTKSCPWYRRITSGLQTRPADLPDYQMRDGHLYRHILHDLDFREMPAEDQWKKCVPAYQRPALLQRLHDDPTAGHLCTAKTMTRIAQLYYWGSSEISPVMSVMLPATSAWRIRCYNDDQPVIYIRHRYPHPGTRCQ
ncbi:hypothetical protein RF55_8899 [Lasius niger]|uniref:Integrase zinc-binding domain-containing protein n=1 Tax=Lasius niger TaxID=67767 RepID=A0A0J7KLZ1_LASNI|nr:hypothetical protein RF55_8899 [Lasius niger]